MNFNSILNQILTAGQEITRQTGNNAPSGMGLQQFPNNQNSFGDQNSNSPFNLDMLKGFGGGAAATGLLSLLLGNKGFGNSALKLGSVAAIGSMAYSAWKNYQAAQQNNSSQIAGFSTDSSPTALTTQFEPPKQDERTSQIIIKAMIAAAAADGRIDTNESNAILAEMANAGVEEQAWLQQQLSAPPTAQDIAADVGNDMALASQVYLASRIVCGDLDRHEIIYLHDLSTAMHLDNALVEQLEKQAGF